MDTQSEMTPWIKEQVVALRQSRWPQGIPPANDVQKQVARARNIAAPEDPALMASEIRRLGGHQRLLFEGDYAVYAARYYQLPTVVSELGRLRELSFREAGEGTGLARDLDRYDDWYTHLFVWDAKARRVLGAYRLAMSDVVLERFGTDGLYSASLFDYDPGFLGRLGPALELGRSFVRPESECASRMLALLWRGINRFIADRSQYRTLFGPVSVSACYSAESRELIARSLSTPKHRHRLSGLVAPRQPLRQKLMGSVLPIADLKALSERILELEAQERGLPTLVREYLKLGGRFLSFSLNPEFSNAMDGLVVVDLDLTDPRLLPFYMGQEH